MCGSGGDVLHDQVRDRLFGAPGAWRYRRCAACRLVWQDPMVLERDVGRLYASYYTHAPPADAGHSAARSMYRRAQHAYIARRYGYAPSPLIDRLLGAALGLYPGRRADADFLAMYLPAAGRGRLLDVGCGHGATLVEMARLGWTAEGIEPDEHAVAVARARGFHVLPGTVFSADLPARAFDAVVMSHVIEHVHRPVETLRRCGELLAPGGRVVVVTPNAESWGHEVFGAAWRGLEPPRHLHVFSKDALARAARAAGLCDPDVAVTIRNARGIYDASQAIRRAVATGASTADIPAPTLRSEAWQLAEWLRGLGRPASGEELVLTARKGA
jgi:2-polyprenyl-3-methyl-5-hydroxy-6-metoxy-1,4-benzoquinol methylase